MPLSSPERCPGRAGFTDPWTWLRTALVPWLVLAAPLAGICVTLATAASLAIVIPAAPWTTVLLIVLGLVRWNTPMAIDVN